jgi:hypothetical protein
MAVRLLTIDIILAWITYQEGRTSYAQSEGKAVVFDYGLYKQVYLLSIIPFEKKVY